MLIVMIAVKAATPRPPLDWIRPPGSEPGDPGAKEVSLARLYASRAADGGLLDPSHPPSRLALSYVLYSPR